MASKANSPPLFWIALVALVLAVAVFSPALNGPLVFDDYHLPFFNPDAARMPIAFWIGGVRPLLMATYWANFAFSGTETWSYHVVNVVLHYVAAGLVFFVLWRLIAFSGYSAAGWWPAAAGAAIFLLHPLQTESVDYIAGRSEVLCAIFVLAGWLMFLDRIERAIGILPAAGIMLCGAAAVLSKESGVCLPLLIVASDFYWHEDSLASRLRKRKFLYAPLLVGLVAAVLPIIVTLNRSSTAGFSGSVGPWSYALTQSRAIMTYFRLFFAPLGQNADWQMPFHRSLREAWPWLLMVLALIVVMIWLFRKVRLASFGLLVFLLALAPTSSFVPIADAMAERRMYLPIVGLVVFLVGAAVTIRIPGKWKALLATTAVIVCGILASERSRLWGSDLLLWEDVIAHGPGNARAHAELGGALMLRRDCSAAAREYKRVVELEGMNEISGRNLATAYECSMQNDLALDTYQALVAVHPDAWVWTRVGYFEALKNHVDVSLAAFEKALRLDPNNSIAYSYRGTGRLALGDMTGAQSDFRRALTIDPDNRVAIMGLAKMQARK